MRNSGSTSPEANLKSRATKSASVNFGASAAQARWATAPRASAAAHRRRAVNGVMGEILFQWPRGTGVSRKCTLADIVRQMKRRHFLVGTVAAAGALVVGCSALPPRQRLVASAPLPLKPGEVGLNGWVKVAPDNSVTAMMARSEMGQGAHTGMAMLL